VNWRLYSVLVGLVAVGLFAGCATQPRTGGVEVDDQVETIAGPTTVISGARVDDVRAVAMGSASSKGWTIVSATDQKVVLRRPVNADAPQAVEIGLGADGMPPTIEVISIFRQAPGGVSVTLNAQLVTKAQGNGANSLGERRIDYTESYRDNLAQSLESLRSTWAAHHQRVARALPPIGTAGQAASETAAELDGDRSNAAPTQRAAPLQSPLLPDPTPTAWGAGPEDEPAPVAQTQARAAPVAVPAPAPVKTAAQSKPQAATPPKAQAAVPTKAQTATTTASQAKAQAATPAKAQAATPTKTQTATATASQTKAQSAAPAKAQAATPTKTQTATATASQPKTQAAAKPAGAFPAPVRTPAPQTRPPAAAAPVSGSENMVTLNRGPQARNEVPNAERYAAMRRCRVQSGRTTVFKRDGASEYLRVYCAGDPAFVVKCTNGVCKGLE
jgi:hypothetical protein